MESKEESKIIYKYGEINQLSIYWNSNSQSKLNLTKEQIIVKKMILFKKKNFIENFL